MAPTEALGGPIAWPAEIVGPTEGSFYEWILLLQSIWGPHLPLPLLAGAFGFCVWSLVYPFVPHFRAQPIISVTGMSALGLCLLYVRLRFLSHRLHSHEDAAMGSLKDVDLISKIDPVVVNEAVIYAMSVVLVLLLVVVLILAARVLALEVGLFQPSSSGWLALTVGAIFIFTIVVLVPLSISVVEEWCHPVVKMSTVSPTGSPAPGPVGSLVEGAYESLRGYLRSRFISSPEGSPGIQNPFVEDGEDTFSYFYNWGVDTTINWGLEVLRHSPFGQSIGRGAREVDTISQNVPSNLLVIISTGIIGVAAYRLMRRGGVDIPDID